MLENVYTLLSRVALHAIFNDADRTQFYGEIGFKISDDVTAPFPEADEIIALCGILSLVAVFPFTVIMGFWKALGLTVLIFSIVMAPIILAHEFPEMARKSKGSLPNLLFPTVSGLVAVIAGFVATVVLLSGLDLETGFTDYATNKWPFAIIHAFWSVTLAALMSSGKFPDITDTKGAKRYTRWICLTDGVFLGAATLILVYLLVGPTLVYLESGGTFSDHWPHSISGGHGTLLVLPPLIAFVVGLIVPVWYRVNLLRIGDSRLIHRSSGEFFGFLRNGRLFTADCAYVGWMDNDGHVWDRHGIYFGDYTDDHYVIRAADAPEMVASGSPPETPLTPTPLPRPKPRKPYRPEPGFVDSLESL